MTTTTNFIESKGLTWPGAKQITRRERHTLEKGKVRTSTTYAITSLTRDRADAKTLLSPLRGRWLIESRFHILDAHLAEDHSHVRTGQAAHAISSIRHMAINSAQKLRIPAAAMCLEHTAKVNLLCQRLHILTN